MNLDLNVLEVDYHPRVVQLKLDHAFVQPAFFFEMFGKFRFSASGTDEAGFFAGRIIHALRAIGFNPLW